MTKKDKEKSHESEEESTDSFQVEGSDQAMEEALKSLDALEKGKKGPKASSKTKDKKSPFSKEQLDELSSLMHKKDEHLKEARDRLLRVSADFDNYKKRSKREQEEAITRGKENYLRGLLSIIDSFERTLAHSDELSDVKTILEGISLIHKQILGYLEEINVKPIEALGKPFDPKYHEALGQEKSEEVPNSHILQELEKGYLLNNRLLRPAKVVVAKNENNEEPPDKPSNSGSSESSTIKC